MRGQPCLSKGLIGKAKDIYSGFLKDDSTFSAYDRRLGWQKTNYVYNRIQKYLANPAKIASMKNPAGRFPFP